ncbi:MAG: hypothetical protein MO852_03510 [Candidatus Devosia euplotis]|nr:hypothetical protein [Candidatus Devosia euplotis]
MAVYSGCQLVALRDENRNFYSAQLQSSWDRLEVGEGTRIDVAQAQARLASGDAAYRSAVSTLEEGRATFQRHVGSAPQSLDAQHNFGRLIPNSLATAIAESGSDHPAIPMAKAAIRAAQPSSEMQGCLRTQGYH